MYCFNPNLHHGVALDEGVDEVGAVLMELALDEELDQIFDQRRVRQPQYNRLTALKLSLSKHGIDIEDCLGNCLVTMILDEYYSSEPSCLSVKSVGWLGRRRFVMIS